MPFMPMNVILDKPLHVNATLSLSYPEGKNDGHLFGGFNHTLSVDGVFFRAPRDFTVIAQPEAMLLTWHGRGALPSGALLNLQLETPGSEFHFDIKTGITVNNMVHSAIYMVNLASPSPNDKDYWVASAAIGESGALKLAHTQVPTPRNVVVHSPQGQPDCTFTIEGEDIYRRSMVEKITTSESGTSAGKKAFARVSRITPSGPCEGAISIGTGDRFGLPVFLPSPGYVIREIVNGVSVTGGTIIGGETAVPTATTGDRRGTYTPPAGTVLNQRHSIHLLLSLLAPGNIGIPDFAG